MQPMHRRTLVILRNSSKPNWLLTLKSNLSTGIELEPDYSPLAFSFCFRSTRLYAAIAPAFLRRLFPVQQGSEFCPPKIVISTERLLLCAQRNQQSLVAQ
jgi:hypothetical protein